MANKAHKVLGLVALDLVGGNTAGQIQFRPEKVSNRRKIHKYTNVKYVICA